MALLDFVCAHDDCDEAVCDRQAPAGTPPPDCPHHGPMVILWRSRSASVDSIPEFEYEHDDGRVERISSLSRARQIEREAEAMTAAGVGRPAVFRHLSQDSSNRDLNVFQHLHPQVPRSQLRTRDRRGRQVISGGTITVEEARRLAEED